LNPASVQYEQRQALADLQYRREYTSWLATLPPADRQALKQKGLHHALIDYHASESARDITERNIAYEPAYEVYPAPDSQKRLWELIERISILLIDAPNPRLEADTLGFMAGFHIRMGKSGTELSAKYGLSRAAWSKRCKRLQEKLGLPPSRSMKSEAACKTYATTNGATPKWIR
jgi:hypothetical protein